MDITLDFNAAERQTLGCVSDKVMRSSWTARNPRRVKGKNDEPRQSFGVVLGQFAGRLRLFLHHLDGPPAQWRWNQYCFISLAVITGGKAVPFFWLGLEHNSASVECKKYEPLLNKAYEYLKNFQDVILLADKGFANQELVGWL